MSAKETTNNHYKLNFYQILSTSLCMFQPFFD